jgi:hypothetical protein
MVKKLAIAHTLNLPTYAILRRRLNGNIYNNTTGAEEELGTWNKARKTECAVILDNKEGGYYQKEFPGGCDDGVWDAFYFVRLGAEIELTDRQLYLEKFINGDASISERSMLAAGHTTGKTVYAFIRSQNDAYIWDAGDSALEAVGTWDDDRAGQCAYALDDKGGGYYTKAFPAEVTTAGTYHIFYNEKLGAEYDTEDRLVGRDKVLWFGTTVSGEVAPTGPRGKAMVNLRNLVAESEAFQAVVGASDSEEAKDYVPMVAYAPEDEVFKDTFALICRTENDKDESIAVDADSVNGDLELWFEQNIPSDYKNANTGGITDAANAELYFLNMYEAVLAEMWTLSRQPGKFAINNITNIEGPMLTQNKTKDWKYLVRLQVGWGIGQ